MKLTPVRVDRALSQINAQAVPDNHPAKQQLDKLFGDHTFFLDGDGLSIVEPAEPHEGGLETGRVVKLASWADANHSSLTPHEREATDMVLVIGKAA